MTNSNGRVIKEDVNKYAGLLKLATHAASRYKVAYRKRDGTPKTTICPKCPEVFEYQTSNYCNDCRNTQEDDYIKGIPNSLVISHCQSCECYSFSPITAFEFVCSPLHSIDKIHFLLKRVLTHLNKLQLDLIDAYFIPSENDSEKTKFKIALVLEHTLVDGTKIKRRHIIVYNVVQEACPCCSCNTDESIAANTYTVTFRRSPLDRKNISGFLFHVLKRGNVAVHRIYKVATNVVDFIFRTENEATTFYNHLYSQFPIRSDKIPGDYAYKNVLLCPIAIDDLVYVRSGSSGRFMICTKVTNSISLFDPESVTETTVSADEYWSDPTKFETYKDKWDLVEYIVLDTNVVLKGTKDAVADMTVARVADYGKNDKVYRTRTHLGNRLKPMDTAYGYDLCGVNNWHVTVANEESFRDVVLLRVLLKGSLRKKTVMRRKTRTEYEDFLQALEKTPETLFNLSLNSRENQTQKHNLSET